MIKPVQGNIVIANLDPTIGHEQAGNRPVLVVSNASYDNESKMTVICPITNTKRNSPMHVKLTATKTTGYVLCDQIRALDFSKRSFRVVENIDYDTLWEVCDIIKSAVDILQGGYYGQAN